MWIPETVLIIILIIVLYFLEKMRVQKDEAEFQNKDLRYRLIEKDERAKLWEEQHKEINERNSKNALRDAFILLCRAKDCHIPEGFTIKEIAEIFADVASDMEIYYISDIKHQNVTKYIDYCLGEIDVSKIPEIEEEIDKVEIVDGLQITTMKNGEVYQSLVPEEQALFDAIEPHWYEARDFLEESLEWRNSVIEQIANAYYDVLRDIYFEDPKRLQDELTDRIMAEKLPTAIRKAVARGNLGANAREITELYQKCLQLQVDHDIATKDCVDNDLSLLDALFERSDNITYE